MNTKLDKINNVINSWDWPYMYYWYWKYDRKDCEQITTYMKIGGKMGYSVTDIVKMYIKHVHAFGHELCNLPY